MSSLPIHDLLSRPIADTLDSILDSLLLRVSPTEIKLSYRRATAYCHPSLGKKISLLDSAEQLVHVEPPDTELNPDKDHCLVYEISHWKTESFHYYRRKEASRQRVATHEKKKEDLLWIEKTLIKELGGAVMPENFYKGKALQIYNSDVARSAFIEKFSTRKSTILTANKNENK